MRILPVLLVVLALASCRGDDVDHRAHQPETPHLDTPQACLENFVISARADDWPRARRSLDLSLLGDVDDARASELARRLAYVLNQELWIDWEALPDRSDGMLDHAVAGEPEAMIGAERTSIWLGEIEAGGRAIPIRVDRRSGPGASPVWLIAAQTCENIDELYAAHGPGWLEQHMPDWARTRGWGRIAWWKWIALGLSFLVAPLLGWLAVRVLDVSLRRVPWLRAELLDALRWPLGALAASAALWLVIDQGLSLPGTVASIVEPLSLVLFVAAATWLVMRGLNFAVEYVAKDAVRSVHEDNTPEQRRVLTQVTVARHVVVLIVALVAIGLLLLQLGVARDIGYTLVTSAGVAAVVFGIAGHAVLGNLIAGLQIALTHPFQLGDTVYVEGNWGQIEDIAYTYVTVKTWDERRLVMPIKYFVENWFENWSLTDTFLVKPIYLRVDYRAPVDAIRERFLELVEADDDWSGEERDTPEVLATETDDETLTLRLTAGADTPGQAWSMTCRIREAMVAWLQELDGGAYLPRRRHVVDGGEVDAPGARPDAAADGPRDTEPGGDGEGAE